MTNIEIVNANARRRGEAPTYRTYVPREFLSQLMTYMPPEGRFMTHDHGLVLFSFAGRHEFIDESRRPVPEETPEEVVPEWFGDE